MLRESALDRSACRNERGRDNGRTPQDVPSSEKEWFGRALEAGQSLLVGECRASRKPASAQAISSWRPSAGSAAARPNVIGWSASAAASAAAIFSKRAMASGTPRFDPPPFPASPRHSQRAPETRRQVPTRPLPRQSASVVRDRVATRREINVGSVVILIRASLIACVRRLVVIRPRLILITRRLVAITRPLITIT